MKLKKYMKYEKNIAQIDDIIDFFHQYKKGNLTKIPKQNL